MATAIFDPNYIDQFAATRYTAVPKGDMVDRYTRAYWDAQQTKKRSLADRRAAQAEQDAQNVWEADQNSKNRNFQTEENAKNRAWQEELAQKNKDKATEGGLAKSATQLAGIGLGADMMFNKGAATSAIAGGVKDFVTSPIETTKAAYESAKSGVTTAGENLGLIKPSPPAEVIPGSVDAAAPAATSATTPGTAAQVGTTPTQGIPGATAEVAPGAQQGITTATDVAPAATQAGAQTIPGAIPASQAESIAAGTAAGADVGAGLGAEQAAIEAGQAAGADVGMGAGGAPIAEASMMGGAGTALGGFAVMSINKALKATYDKSLGDFSPLAYGLGRGIGGAMVATGVGTMAVAAGLASTGVGMPVAACIVAASVISELHNTRQFKQAQEAIQKIPILGKTADILFFEPFKFASDVVGMAFGVLESIGSIFTGGSWICTRVASTTVPYDRAERAALSKLLRYGLKHNREVTRFYYYGANGMVDRMCRNVQAMDILRHLRATMIDPIIDLVKDGEMRHAFDHYVKCCQVLYREFSPNEYVMGMSMVKG